MKQRALVAALRRLVRLLGTRDPDRWAGFLR